MFLYRNLKSNSCHFGFTVNATFSEEEKYYG